LFEAGALAAAALAAAAVLQASSAPAASGAHLVHCAKAEATNGVPLALTEGRGEANDIRPLQHTQRHCHHHCVCLEAMLISLHGHTCRRKEAETAAEEQKGGVEQG
jgi:hypothetical protein